MLLTIPVDAHFTQISYYNSESMGIGNKYFIDQALMPEYAKPNEQANIMFSIQDKNGNDVSNVDVMVEIYSAAGELMHVLPWTNLAIGDFKIPYTFEKNGNYHYLCVRNSDFRPRRARQPRLPYDRLAGRAGSHYALRFRRHRRRRRLRLFRHLPLGYGYGGFISRVVPGNKPCETY